MYSKRLAFNYLEDLAQEFHQSYGRRVNTVTRPYAFIEFDVYIQKAKKNLTDRRRNINSINNQLQDVQRIMVMLAQSNLDSLDGGVMWFMEIYICLFLFSLYCQVQNIDDVLQRGTVLSGEYPINCDDNAKCIYVGRLFYWTLSDMNAVAETFIKLPVHAVVQC